MSDSARRRLCVTAARFWLGLSLAAPALGAGNATPSVRPVVAGFERFAADPKADPAAGGRLLLGELGCVACHRAEPAAAAHLAPKAAPVLDAVGARVRPAYLRAFLADPHGVKPGTTMPDPFAGWPAAEKAEAVEALTHLLASTGAPGHGRRQVKEIAEGSRLYRTVGCLACHGPRTDRPEAAAGAGAGIKPATAIPLGDLTAKYTIPGLAAFLADPLKARPDGRMPASRLTSEEARSVAQFLLRDAPGTARPNLEYRYYEGSWDKLPDLGSLTPRATGRADGFDPGIAPRGDNFALRFEGTLRIDRPGFYTLKLASDDGSRLSLDGGSVLENDGIHPPQEKTARVRIAKGSHRLTVDYFNAGGGAELGVRIEGEGLADQPLDGYLVPIDEKAGNSPGPEDDRVTPDPALVEKGRALFARVGCASCHQLRVNGTTITATTEAKPLAALTVGAGCLAGSPPKGSPDFALSDHQRAALGAALGSLGDLARRAPTREELIDRAFTAFNCYACHSRGGRGGVEPGRNASFETTQREMGDEGRIPPLLDGVGAKLEPGYLARALADGLKDRPYMLTRMPRFGAANTAALAGALAAADTVEPVPVPEFEDTPRRVKSAGRFLVGGEALGCVKCHTFKGIQAEGVQAIDMTVMHRRLRRDWFHRYVVNPPAYRPGTRMPTGWPDGKSMLPKVLGGDTVRQVEAVWRFLADGGAAATPYGVGRDPMPLVPLDGRPIVYRNFIEGAGPRAIGVGYPERANLAFDANDLRLALIWQQGFIDASRHWSGRGEGFQPPMGDNVVALPAGVAFASLSSPSQPWPSQPARAMGYAFRGYRLDPAGRPTFGYDLNGVHVEDRPEAVPDPKAPGLKRTLTLTPASASAPAPDGLFFRAAVGDTIAPAGSGWYQVSDEYKVRIAARGGPVVRSSGGKKELLVPVDLDGGPAEIVEEFAW